MNIRKILKNLIFFISIILFSCNKPTSIKQFNKLIYNLNEHKDSIEFGQWINRNIGIKQKILNDTLKVDTLWLGTGIYEDEQFKAYQYCFGEFGGAIYFIERGVENYAYFLECTCPLMIERRNDKYIITETLAHLSGSGTIQVLNSPKELVKISLDSIPLDWKSARYPTLSEYEIYDTLRHLEKVLLDTVGITLDLFFEFDNSDYLIYSDYQNTFLGRVADGTIELQDTLLKLPSWRYNESPNEIINGIYHYTNKAWGGFSNKEIRKRTRSTGDIYVKNDTIVIGYYYWESIEPNVE